MSELFEKGLEYEKQSVCPKADGQNGQIDKTVYDYLKTVFKSDAFVKTNPEYEIANYVYILWNIISIFFKPIVFNIKRNIFNADFSCHF